jgi:hypothetical protein
MRDYLEEYNDCEKCPYYSCYTPYWSDDGCPVENCEAGLNPEEGCKHSGLVRWVKAKLYQRKIRKEDEYYRRLLAEEDDEI